MESFPENSSICPWMYLNHLPDPPVINDGDSEISGVGDPFAEDPVVLLVTVLPSAAMDVDKQGRKGSTALSGGRREVQIEGVLGKPCLEIPDVFGFHLNLGVVIRQQQQIRRFGNEVRVLWLRCVAWGGGANLGRK